MSFLNKSIVAGVGSLFLASSLLVGTARAADDKKPAAKPAAEGKSGDKEKSKSEEKSKPTAKDEDAKEEKAGEAKASDKPIKLTKPWSDLTKLTDDQKAKIKAIHVKALAEINALEKQERADIEALLTDEQKTELAELKKKPKKDAPAKEKPDADEKKSDAKKPDAK